MINHKSEQKTKIGPYTAALLLFSFSYHQVILLENRCSINQTSNLS
jgi:hypothetical protein